MRKGFLAVCLLLTTSAALRAQTWKPLGPPGGDVRALTADPARPNRIFLGTADGHIFGSEDSGAHWSLLGRASSRLGAVITAIVVDPRDGNVLFASSWTRDAAAGGGVYRSVDSGRTWSGAGLAGQAVRTLAMAPSYPNVLVAGTLDGISQDAGKTWQQAAMGLPSTPVQDFAAAGGLFVASMRTGGLYVSSDFGRTWDRVPGALGDGFFVAVASSGEPGVIIAACATEGLYRLEWPGSEASDAGFPGRSRKETTGEEASPVN
jgi:photosystem II stability/assembly factor-like uncharacterized protein